MIVLELYRRATIPSGKAAELLGMDRIDFIKHASRLGIPCIEMTEDEWVAEMAALDALSGRQAKVVAKAVYSHIGGRRRNSARLFPGRCAGEHPEHHQWKRLV